MKKIFFISVAIWSILIGSLTTVTVSAASTNSVAVGLTYPVTSLNPFTRDGNTSSNMDVWKLTSAHFHYSADQGLEKSTQLGTLEVLSNTSSLFQIKQTINPGNFWSDGTPIDAVDLLLSYVISSSAYSTQAGLGNPSQTTPAFNSVIYGSSFDSKLIGEPIVSSDRRSLTYSFSGYFSDWQASLGLAQPAHILEMLAYPGLSPVDAKNQFLLDFQNKATARLMQMGAIWSSGYNLQNLSSTSASGLFVTSGQFQLSPSSLGTALLKFNQVQTFTAMPKSPINQVSIKYVSTQDAATQDLARGEIDIFYQPNATRSGFASCLAGTGLTCTQVFSNVFQFVNLRVSASPGQAAYSGPFAGNSAQARDLRKAFLLSIPTESIDESIYKLHPSLPATKNPTVRIAALSRIPTSAEFNQAFSDGIYKSKTLSERQAIAKTIVQQYFPSWDGTPANSPVNISMNFAITSQSRVSTFSIIRASVSQSGFNLSATDSQDWIGRLNSSQHDAQMHGLIFPSGSLESDLQSAKEMYGSLGGNNWSGWSNVNIDNMFTSLLSRPLTAADDGTLGQLATSIQSEYWTLPIGQSSGFIGAVSSLYINHDVNVYAQNGDGLFGRHFGWSFDAPLAVAPVSTPSPTPTPVVSASPSVSPAPVVSASPSVTSAPVVSASPSVSSAPVVSSSPSVSSAPVVLPAPTATAFPTASPTPTSSSPPKPTPTASTSVRALSVPSSAITLPAGSTFITKSVTAKLQSYAKSIVAGKYSQIVIPVKTQGTTLTKAVNQAKAMAKVLVKAKVKANVTVTYSGNKASVRITARK
jgi:peptide/nickel transport system substrate-binding protein